jgi:rfaE bifunctional protein nucleotidyltransferase chain/domain
MTHLQILNNKIYELPSLLRQLAVWRLKNDKIVFTNGCFDIIHQGHITLLSQAADHGTRLIIGLNTDTSIEGIKKPGRPLQDEKSRALILASLGLVDAAIFFSEPTPIKLINLIKPDVLVKGGDYTIETIVGSKEVIENGGKVEVIKLLEGYSTTGIEDKIKKYL